MRGTNGNAVKALRAYAREIEAAVDVDAPVRVGHSRQSEAVTPSARKGTTPLLPLAVVSFVLVGTVAFAAVTGTNGTDAPNTAAQTATPGANTAATTVQRQPEANAQRAVLLLASRGLSETAATVEGLIESGAADDPTVAAAIEAVQAVVAARPSMPLAMLASEPAVIAAIDLLEAAARPPGLDPGRTPAGQGGTPPGQDDTFTPPGQDDTFTPPGQDDTFTPPGQDDTFTPPGQDDTFTPPGQDDTFTPPGQDESGPGAGRGSDRSGNGTSDR